MTNQSQVATEEAAPKSKVRRIPTKPTRKSADLDTPIKEEPPATSLDAESNHKSEKKRSNRRRRGKGKSGHKEVASLVTEETQAHTPEQKKDKSDPREKLQQTRPHPPKTRRKIDPDKIAKNAWKIFLAEVSEEGVALIADNDARVLAKRCFRLSEIFLEEEVMRD